MRDEEVPDYGLECLAVGRDVICIHGRNDDAGVGHFRGKSAVLADDADDARSDLFREQISSEVSGRFVRCPSLPYSVLSSVSWIIIPEVHS